MVPNDIQLANTAAITYCRIMSGLYYYGVLRHRIALNYEANADGVSSNDIIDEILKLVAIA